MTAYRVSFPGLSMAPLDFAFVDDPHDPYVLEAIAAHVAGFCPTALVQVTINAATLSGTIGIGGFRRAGALRITEVSDPDMDACRVCGCTDTDATGCLLLTGEPCSWIDDLSTAGRICSRCFVHTGVRT